MNPFAMPSGHAVCTSCNGDVDLNQELYGFNTRVASSSNEILYYFLCAKCGIEFNNLNATQSEAFAKEIIITRTTEWLNGDKSQYAMTSLTALIANNFDPADAIDYGVPLSKELSNKIVLGEIDPYDIAQFLRHIAFNYKISKGTV